MQQQIQCEQLLQFKRQHKSKVFESLTCDKINEWIEKKNILNKEQSGFTKKNRFTHDYIFQLIQSYIQNKKNKISSFH